METTEQKPLWIEAIDRFDLDVSESVKIQLSALVKEYNLGTENEAFFYYIKNKIGHELSNIGEPWPDLMSWLKITNRTGMNDWYMYTFEEKDDYTLWKKFREDAYKYFIDESILIFFEMNCVEFISDPTVKKHKIKKA